MVSSIGFPAGQLPPSSACSNVCKTAITGMHSPGAATRYCPNPLMKMREHTVVAKDHRFQLLTPFARSSDSAAFQVLSPTDITEQLYSCINRKDMRGIEELISDDCCLEDYSFPRTFRGKKDTLTFFRQLTESMGENVRFRIGHVYQGQELVACADWHLDWKQNQIPFTRGCSLFQCSKEGQRFLIKEARILVESPIKPGMVVMAILKMLTSVFDDFPGAAEWFLRSPRIILEVLTSIYKLFLGPLVNPLLGFYVNVWKFMARVLGCTLSILHCIAKHLK